MYKNFLKVIPSGFKKKIRSSKYYELREAKRLSSNSKRVDVCAAQFSHHLKLANMSSISGKVCLEVGCGWVLSHSLVCYLLGAKKIFATDIFPHAHPEVLFFSLHNSIPSLIRDLLSDFEEHSIIRERLDYLLSLKKIDFTILKNIGIEYISPFDFSENSLKNEVDFIFSNSVLEHVNLDVISPLLDNMVKTLKHNGEMIHCIHMEDHESIDNDPFDFLSIDSSLYLSSMQSVRGNRLRGGSWCEKFDDISSLSNKIIYSWKREGNKPKIIDSSIVYIDEIDLLTSHIGIYSIKNNICLSNA